MLGKAGYEEGVGSCERQWGSTRQLVAGMHLATCAELGDQAILRGCCTIRTGSVAPPTAVAGGMRTELLQVGLAKKPWMIYA